VAQLLDDDDYDYITHVFTLEKELNKIGLRHIWGNPTENQRGTVCKEVKERCNDIERQLFFCKFK
jgi:hypothetical protein